MAIVTTNDRHYSEIADSIRAKGVSGSFTPNEMADAINLITDNGAVTGTFTFASKSFYVTITHNADLSDYIFVAQMQSASLEALKLGTGEKSNYAVAFMYICSDNFYDFVGSATLPMEKQGLRWNYQPSTNAFALSTGTTASLGNYTKDSVKGTTAWGVHAGTYDWYAFPLN